MFGSPTDPNFLPNDILIARPHSNYVVKRSGIRRSRLCANGSKFAAPQLHSVVNTWSSYVEFPMQRLFMGLSAENGLRVWL